MIRIKMRDIEFSHEIGAKPSWLAIVDQEGNEAAKVGVTFAKFEPTDEATIHLTVELPDEMIYTLFIALSVALKKKREFPGG